MAKVTICQKILKGEYRYNFTTCDNCATMFLPGQPYIEIEDKLFCMHCIKSNPMGVMETLGAEPKIFMGRE
jgi:hypothetical protein